MTAKAASKPKRAAVDWPKIRALFEAGGPGATFRSLAGLAGVSHVGVMKRAEREGWKQDLEPSIRAATSAKVTGLVTTGNLKETAAAVDAEAERRAEVIRRHRDEWNAARERINAGLAAHRAAGVTPEVPNPTLTERRAAKAEAFDDLKAAKITAEAITLVQAGERKAHRLDEPPVQPPGSRSLIEIIYRDGAPVTVED